VLFRNGRLIEYNKQAPRREMAYIDYGLGVICADVLRPYPAETPFDLADVYQVLSAKGHLAGLEVHERFYEIGSHEGLKEARDYFLSRRKHELRVATPEGSWRNHPKN